MNIQLTSDQINALLELGGAIFLIPSLIEAFKKKLIVGVSWITPIFFTSWGLWNCWYYPSLGQYYSAIAAIIMFIANIVWLGMILKYKDNKI